VVRGWRVSGRSRVVCAHAAPARRWTTDWWRVSVRLENLARGAAAGVLCAQGCSTRERPGSRSDPDCWLTHTLSLYRCGNVADVSVLIGLHTRSSCRRCRECGGRRSAGLHALTVPRARCRLSKPPGRCQLSQVHTLHLAATCATTAIHPHTHTGSPGVHHLRVGRPRHGLLFSLGGG
jgi:hypothetical protein